MDFSPIADTSIIDLVLLFVEHISNEKHLEPSDGMFSKLEKQGFSHSQLEYAYSLVMEKIILSGEKHSVRIFSESELKNLSSKAASIFVKLNQLGIITDEQVEIVLMRAAVIPDEELSEDELKMIIAMMLDKKEKDLPDGFFVPEDNENIH